MSVSMTKSEGVTVLTLNTDPQSALPPICQILKSLCYSPVCCSVSQRLKMLQGNAQTILGTLHIMVGLLNIGLGAILRSSGVGSTWQMDEYGYPYWLGGLFIFFGVMCILSERFPSPCLVSLSVIANLTGIAFAIAAIVLYSVNIGKIRFWWSCDNSDNDYYYYRRRATTAPPDEEMIRKCMETRALIMMILRGINAVLIVLSVLELTVTISAAVLAIKGLCKGLKSENKMPKDPESYKPLLENVTSNPAA